VEEAEKREPRRRAWRAVVVEVVERAGEPAGGLALPGNERRNAAHSSARCCHELALHLLCRIATLADQAMLRLNGCSWIDRLYFMLKYTYRILNIASPAS
jgi:hypothetical protein